MKITEELMKMDRPFIFQTSTNENFTDNLSGGLNGDSRQIAIMVLAVIAEMLDNDDINAVKIIIDEANNMLQDKQIK